MAIRLSGMSEKAYTRSFNHLQNVLDVKNTLDVRELAIQFGCVRIIPFVQKGLKLVFEVQCLHILVYDRTAFEGLVEIVERVVREEHTSSPNRPIYLVGDSFGGCLALDVAARNPTVDLVLVLANPATSLERSQLKPLFPVLEVLPDELHNRVPYLLSFVMEVPLIEGILNPLNGVKEISVVVPTKTLMVVHDIHLIHSSQIVHALNQARLEASVRPRGESNYTKKWPGKWNIASGLFLLLSFFKYIYHPMQWFAIVTVLIGVPNIIWRSIASIRNLTLNVNVIVLIAVGGTIALQDYTDAAIIVFLYNIAQWLKSRASYKAMSVMSSLTSMTPLKATLAKTGKQVDVTSVDLGTSIDVKAGEVIPIDGVVLDGKCDVDEKALLENLFRSLKKLAPLFWQAQSI